MPYDFTSYYDRKVTKASKWEAMLSQNPDVREGVVPMTTADMDFMHAPEINQALHQYIDANLLGYSRPTDNYRAGIVRHYQQAHGYDAKPEWLFTLPGVVPALATAVRTCTQPGDAVLVLTPVYGPFYQVVEGQGRRVVGCPLNVKDRRYHIDFQLLETLCQQQKPKLFLLCSPHNPSGRVWTKEELRRMADICHANGVQVVSDEIHCDIILGDVPHTVFNTVSKQAEGAILCTSAGKTFNIQALQCANVFIKDPALRQAYERASNIAGIERANVLGMVATQAAYEKGQPWLRELTQVIKENHQLLLQFFQGYPDSFLAFIPDAGFLGWVDYSPLDTPREQFLAFLKDCDFYITDGFSFGPGGDRHMRINVGLPTHALKENLSRLEQGLKERYGLQHKA